MRNAGAGGKLHRAPAFSSPRDRLTHESFSHHVVSIPASSQEPRWRRLPEERPRQILDAALSIFAERGLANARLEDIAKRAGLSKGTIYLYFPNKEELFREVVRHTVIANLEQAEQDLAAEGSSVAETFARFVRGFWSFAASPAYTAIFRLVHAELHSFPDLVQFYFDEAVTRSRLFIQRLVERGIATGEFREIDPAVAARMLSSTIVMHALWRNAEFACSRLPDRSDEQVCRDLIDYHLHALRREPRSA